MIDLKDMYFKFSGDVLEEVDHIKFDTFYSEISKFTFNKRYAIYLEMRNEAFLWSDGDWEGPSERIYVGSRNGEYFPLQGKILYKNY